MKPALEHIDLLNLELRLNTTPAITFSKPGTGQPPVNPAKNGQTGFNLELEAVLPYNQLSAAATAYVRGTRLNISEGFIHKHIIIDGCNVYGLNNQLAFEVPFSGSFDGTVYLKGTPFYNIQAQTIALQNISYDVKSTNFLLKSLKWLFDKLILEQIKKYAVIDIAAYYQKAAEALTKLLNQELATGIQAAGTVTVLEVTGIEARQEQLVVGLRCSGDLRLTLPALQLKL